MSTEQNKLSKMNQSIGPKSTLHENAEAFESLQSSRLHLEFFPQTQRFACICNIKSVGRGALDPTSVYLGSNPGSTTHLQVCNLGMFVSRLQILTIM